MLGYLTTKLRQLIRHFSGPRARYIVEVDDNFHYMDESERYTLGEFATAEAALAAAKAVVDDYLKSIYQEGMTADELYRHYTAWGEDPHISRVDVEDEVVKFSAWTYAQQRSRELCRGTRP